MDTGSRLEGHAANDAVNLAYHKAIATKLRSEPAVLDRARLRVPGWLNEGTVSAYYAELWDQALAGSMDDLLAVLADRSERATAMRQVSPFAGALTPQERWAIWRRVRRPSGRGA